VAIIIHRRITSLTASFTHVHTTTTADFINALMNDDVRLSKTMSLDQSSMNYELLAASGENTCEYACVHVARAVRRFATRWCTSQVSLTKHKLRRSLQHTRTRVRTVDPEAYGGLGQQAMQNDISAIITRTENLPGYVVSGE
jgi:hypothetical protein